MNEEETKGMNEIQQWLDKNKDLMFKVIGKATIYVDTINFGVDSTRAMADLRLVLGEFWAHHRESKVGLE